MADTITLQSIRRYFTRFLFSVGCCVWLEGIKEKYISLFKMVEKRLHDIVRKEVISF